MPARKGPFHNGRVESCRLVVRAHAIRLVRRGVRRVTMRAVRCAPPGDIRRYDLMGNVTTVMGRVIKIRTLRAAGRSDRRQFADGRLFIDGGQQVLRSIDMLGLGKGQTLGERETAAMRPTFGRAGAAAAMMLTGERRTASPTDAQQDRPAVNGQ